MKTSTVRNSLKKIIVNNMHQIEERRQYLKDIRFLENNVNTPIGSQLDLNDLIHFKQDFIDYVKENHYPFKNSYYKLKHAKKDDVDAFLQFLDD